jgi:dephospho-CoA kinase
MFVVGLTGGIGSGKSTVANLLAARGAALVDTDVIAHELTTGGSARAIPAIRKALGEEMIADDGSLDRAAMRHRVFAEPAARQILESILHPMIREAVAAQLQSAATRAAPYTLLAVPLLFESTSYRQQLDETLVVDCPVALQILRVQQRSSLPVAEISRIIAAQIPRVFRLQLADRVLFNADTIEALERPIETLHHHYVHRAAGTRASA